MPGLENDVLVAKNVNFDYTATPPHAGIITADGQLLIGASTEPFLRAGTLTSTGGTIAFTPGPGTLNIEAINTGTGNVVGPASATDEAIARYNGTTGKIIQNSLVTISDTGVTVFQNGTLGAPIIGFVGSASDTGFYSSGANVVDLAVSGNHMMSVSATSFGVTGAFFSFEQGLQMKSFVFPGLSTTINTTDFIIYVSQSAPINITLPLFPLNGETHIIKDYSRTAGTNNITILGNGKNIDGAASYVINVNGGAVMLHYQSTTADWSVL